MVISHQKKFIFIHIYKTGGTSITDALFPYARLVEKVSGYYPSRHVVRAINYIFKLQDNGNSWINGVHKHATAEEIRHYLGSDLFEQYFKFSFVRNPYDLQVSLYNYVKQSRSHRDRFVANEKGFKGFLEENIKSNPLCQIDFITDSDGFLLVDYVGKLETFDASMTKVTQAIGIPYTHSRHLNRSKRDTNTMRYYDSESVAIVNSYFRRDFDFFDYPMVQKD